LFLGDLKQSSVIAMTESEEEEGLDEEKGIAEREETRG
jgi:hypothetical protein